MNASIQPLIWWKRRFPAALDRLETIFPRLFLMSISRVKPDLVFSLLPRNTTDLASRPEATLDTRFAFRTFMTFIAFVAEVCTMTSEREFCKGGMSLECFLRPALA